MSAKSFVRAITVTLALAVCMASEAKAQSAPDQKWSVDAAIGWDNSISGNINSSGIGTINNQTTVITKNMYEDVYGTGLHLKVGVGYMVNPTTEARATVSFQSLDADLTRMGDYGASNLYGQYDDYQSTTLQPPDRAAKLYLPLAITRGEAKRMEFLIRSTGDPAPTLRGLRRQIRDAAPGTIVANAFTLDQIIAIAGEEMLVGTAPLFPLIATGMLLTAAGLYGVLAFAITRRSRELAVRVAIGATGRDIVRLVTAHSLRLVVLGTCFGTGATFALTRVARATGGGGSVFDPGWAAFAVPVLIILVIGVLATWIPSRRALRINPAILLRTT